MLSSISFVLDGRVVDVAFDNTGLSPTTTVLNYLRTLPTHKGVKEGCAEGDCGACTVVLADLEDDGRLHYKAVDSCLVFLPMLHGKQLITVENLRPSHETLHPVQEEMVETNGSQCGYCTPGIIMSLFSLYKNEREPSRAEVEDALTGNLCRCTGYKPIIEAASKACVYEGKDQFTLDEPRIVELLTSIKHETVHIRTPLQQYVQPVTLAEALSLKRQHPDAVVINGATDVALRVTKKHEVLKEIIDLSAVKELKRVAVEEQSMTLGAGLSLQEVMGHVRNDFPALFDMLTVFGSRQIRNLATLGGNIGTASPIGDTLPVLIAYGAKVVLQNADGKREVPLDGYITGYRQTVRKPDELVTAVILPKPRPHTIVKSYKVSKRKDLDISTVSGGFKVVLSTTNGVALITLAYGGLAERTKRAAACEHFLLGKQWNREVIEQAMPLIDTDFSPISDARGSAEFRRVAAKNLLLKFWSETAAVNN